MDLSTKGSLQHLKKGCVCTNVFMSNAHRRPGRSHRDRYTYCAYAPVNPNDNDKKRCL